MKEGRRGAWSSELEFTAASWLLALLACFVTLNNSLTVFKLQGAFCQPGPIVTLHEAALGSNEVEII